MLNKNARRLLIIGVVTIIVLVLLGILSLARVIVEKGTGREEIAMLNKKIKEDSVEDIFSDSEFESETYSVEIESEQNTESTDGDTMSELDTLVWESRIVSDDVMKDIERSKDLVFSSIDAPDAVRDYDGIMKLDRYKTDIYSNDFITKGNPVIIDGLPEIIGVSDPYVVAYRFGNDTDRILVVDYDGSSIVEDEGFDYGSVNIIIDPKYSKLISRSNYRVLYTKEAGIVWEDE